MLPAFSAAVVEAPVEQAQREEALEELTATWADEATVLEPAPHETPQASTDAPVQARVAAHEAWGSIYIPRFDTASYVIEEGDKSAVMGKDKLTTESSPYADMPGQVGNTVIFGHRSPRANSPFNEINELKAGDEAFITTAAGTYRYVFVDRRDFEATNVSVFNEVPFSDTEAKKQTLTLIACFVPYSDSDRIAATFEYADFIPKS